VEGKREPRPRLSLEEPRRNASTRANSARNGAGPTIGVGAILLRCASRLMQANLESRKIYQEQITASGLLVCMAA